MIDSIEFGTFEEWLELPLDLPRDVLADSIFERFRDDPKPKKVKRQVAQGLCDLRDQMAGATNESMGVFAAWVLLPSGGQRLTVEAAAMGALFPAAPGATAAEFVESFIAGAALHQPVELSEMATPLGTAHVLRARTYKEALHGIELAETVTVFWLFDDAEHAVALTTLPMDDLVLASDVASALKGLARTAHDGGVAA